LIHSKVESFFRLLDETAVLIQKELSCSYLEALAETGENVFHQKILQEELSEIAEKRLKKKYEEINIARFEKEDIRKAFQLACLKGMKENVQPNHQMTPDSIGLFFGYLVKKFIQNRPSISIMDPAVGTGNLLLTVLNHLNDSQTNAVGVEIDDLLIKLAYINSNLQEHPVQLFNQDSLEPLFTDKVDVVICDLPVGYYPNDLRANDFELKADEGHSYSHHLFIEQSYCYTKEGGYLFFLIPNGLFESVQAPKLHAFIKDHLYIQALIQLPKTMFKNEKAAKSIFVLQKKKEGLKPPKQVLLANLPSLSNKKAMEEIFIKINKWFEDNK